LGWSGGRGDVGSSSEGVSEDGAPGTGAVLGSLKAGLLAAGFLATVRLSVEDSRRTYDLGPEPSSVGRQIACLGVVRPCDTTTPVPGFWKIVINGLPGQLARVGSRVALPFRLVLRPNPAGVVEELNP